MFTTIQSAKRGPAPTETPDAVDALTACHARIRHFSGVSVRLANAEGLPSSEIAQAAEGLIRYFSIALPLHARDEDESIEPRLRRFLPEGELAGPAASAMVEQHQEIDRLLEALLPLWTLLSSRPAKLAEFAPELRSLSLRLDDLFRAHLQMEEVTVFPAMRKYLPERELKGIALEIQERRR